MQCFVMKPDKHIEPFLMIQLRKSRPDNQYRVKRFVISKYGINQCPHLPLGFRADDGIADLFSHADPHPGVRLIPRLVVQHKGGTRRALPLVDDAGKFLIL